MKDDIILRRFIDERTTYQGLSDEEAENQLKIYGPNAMPAQKKKTWIKRLLDIASEPMLLLLIGASFVYLFLGDFFETAVLLISIIPVVIMQFIEEQRTDEAIRALDTFMTHKSMVYRNGAVLALDSRQLVPGDLVYLTAGDRVPADGLLLRSIGLMVDESLLTGESVAVVKAEVQREIIDEQKMFHGTLVVQGEGYVGITATGARSEYGKLGGLLEKIVQQKTPLQKKIHSMVKMVALVALSVALVVGVVLGITEGWVQGVLGGITVAMSLIPEEFPIVFSVFLIMGVLRMTKERALVREMVMVEMLGSVTVICTDKTGTLTEGNMTLKKVYHNGAIHLIDKQTPSPRLVPLFHSALLALEQVAVDPIEIEIQHYASLLGEPAEEVYHEHELLSHSPFNSKTKLVSHTWRSGARGCVQYTAGAPESILERCTLSAEEKRKVETALTGMLEDGFRVIGIAERVCKSSGEASVSGLHFLGLLGMSDPPREGVAEAIDVCQRAGIRIIMITGDNMLTAHNIAESIKLAHRESICSGIELEKMSPDALKEAVKRHDIFARVQPEQKFKIVEALQSAGEVVAMTGDGVNDAPALKKANVGISMGKRGTEVARAASGIILLDDNFAAIVSAVKEGRRIYDNLRQAFVFLFSFHIPIVGLSILPLLLGHPFIFSPIHIVFLELLCDPAAVLGFEREKPRHNLMHEPPRSPKEPLIRSGMWGRIFFQGLMIFVVSGCFYFVGTFYFSDILVGRTLALSSLIVAQAAFIVFEREWHQVKSNKLLLIIPVVTIAVMSLILLIPPLRTIFHLAPIFRMDLVVAVFAVPILSAYITRVILGVSRKRGTG